MVNLLKFAAPTAALSALLLAGCSSDDNPAPNPGPTDSQIAPSNLSAWDGVAFQFNPIISISGGTVTAETDLRLETESFTVDIPAGSSGPVLWERMNENFGNLISDDGEGIEVRFTVGEFQGTPESISSFTLSIYVNDEPVDEYRNVTATVTEGTLRPGAGDIDPGDIEPIGEQYTTVVRERIVGSNGVGDLPDWEIGELVLVQIPSDYSQVTLFDDGEPATFELAGESGFRRDYFANVMEDEGVFTVTITLFLDGEEQPSAMTVVLNESLWTGESFMVTYELDF